MGEKVGLTHFDPLLHPKNPLLSQVLTHFWTHFSPSTKTQLEPTLSGNILFSTKDHVYLNSVQQMVSGELAREGLQTGFSRHGLPPQRAPLDTVYPLREHLNSVQRMVSGGYCEGLFPDTVCWTRLRNTWSSSFAIVGACAMTTKFLDNKICNFKILLSSRFP